MAANYEIVGVSRTVDLAAGAGSGYMIEVRFKTVPHGGQGAVLVPADGYTAQAAADAVGPAAAAIERTFDL